MATRQPGLEEAEPKKGMAALQIVDESGEIVSWEDFGQYDFEDDGTEEIRPSFPNIKLVQSTSSMEGATQNVGKFWHSDRETFEYPLEVVALARRETRALFEEGRLEPACLSIDGKAPLPNQPKWAGSAQPAACAECPFSSWGEDNSPPPCGKSEVLLVDRGDGDLAQFRVNGTGIKPLRQFIARRCKPKHLPLYAFRLTFTASEMVGPGKKWQQLEVDGDLQTPAVAQRYSDMLRSQREAFEKTLRETTDTDGVEWVDDPADLPQRDQSGGDWAST